MKFQTGNKHTQGLLMLVASVIFQSPSSLARSSRPIIWNLETILTLVILETRAFLKKRGILQNNKVFSHAYPSTIEQPRISNQSNNSRGFIRNATNQSNTKTLKINFLSNLALTKIIGAFILTTKTNNSRHYKWISWLELETLCLCSMTQTWLKNLCRATRATNKLTSSSTLTLMRL